MAQLCLLWYMQDITSINYCSATAKYNAYIIYVFSFNKIPSLYTTTTSLQTCSFRYEIGFRLTKSYNLINPVCMLENRMTAIVWTEHCKILILHLLNFCKLYIKMSQTVKTCENSWAKNTSSGKKHLQIEVICLFWKDFKVVHVQHNSRGQSISGTLKVK